MSERAMWERYKQHLVVQRSIGLRLDVSRMKFGPRFLDEVSTPMQRAFDAMCALENGAIANPDEGRQVGHYWLRNPSKAPSPELAVQIEDAISNVKRFAADVHAGVVRPPNASKFRTILQLGIGGSALGPQLTDCALASRSDPMRIRFLDNTDPDGMQRVLDDITPDGLRETLVLVVSKSGGTKETRNAMIEVARAYERAGLDFAKHAVAVTQQASTLSKAADEQGWLEQFPMWSWVGGRTSQTSVVGLLPAALQGFDIDALLHGARACDEVTRLRDARKNPAMLLALMWLHARSAGIAKDMVVLPYKDRLALLTRYLQQLIMESIGKNRDLQGSVVQQGITVYGNKGSTDQHAYVQQLRDGTNNFFAIFIDVLRDRSGPCEEVEPGVTSGDYLLGFMLGTRQALHESDRESMTITIDEVSARSLGVLIALFERAVGFYAALVGINAYHQPGVEAGKVAATAVLQLQERIVAHLRAHRGRPLHVEQIVGDLCASDDVETAFKILEHLAANPARGISRCEGASPFDATYAFD